MLFCMSSALSQPGGAGLGTLGSPPNVCERLGYDAGFKQVRLVDFDGDPFNNYFELKP